MYRPDGDEAAPQRRQGRTGVPVGREHHIRGPEDAPVGVDPHARAVAPDAADPGLLVQHGPGPLRRARQPADVLRRMQPGAPLVDEEAVIEVGAELGGRLRLRDETDVVAELARQQVAFAACRVEVRGTRRCFDVPAADELALDRFVVNQPLERVDGRHLPLEPGPGAGTAVAANQRGRVERQAGQHLPAVARARSPADRLLLEHDGAPAAQGDLARRRQAGITAANHRDVGTLGQWLRRHRQLRRGRPPVWGFDRPHLCVRGHLTSGLRPEPRLPSLARANGALVRSRGPGTPRSALAHGGPNAPCRSRATRSGRALRHTPQGASSPVRGGPAVRAVTPRGSAPNPGSLHSLAPTAALFDRGAPAPREARSLMGAPRPMPLARNPFRSRPSTPLRAPRARSRGGRAVRAVTPRGAAPNPGSLHSLAPTGLCSIAGPRHPAKRARSWGPQCPMPLARNPFRSRPSTPLRAPRARSRGGPAVRAVTPRGAAPNPGSLHSLAPTAALFNRGAPAPREARSLMGAPRPMPLARNPFRSRPSTPLRAPRARSRGGPAVRAVTPRGAAPNPGSLHSLAPTAALFNRGAPAPREARSLMGAPMPHAARAQPVPVAPFDTPQGASSPVERRARGARRYAAGRRPEPRLFPLRSRMYK